MCAELKTFLPHEANWKLFIFYKRKLFTAIKGGLVQTRWATPAAEHQRLAPEIATISILITMVMIKYINISIYTVVNIWNWFIWWNISMYLPHSKDHNHADHEEGEKREKGAQREDEGLRKYWILGQSRTTQVGWRNSPLKLPNQSFLCSSYFMCRWIIFVHDDFVDFSKARTIFH